ncbi:MAG: leucine-rich repeat domain-containing protein [Oscillospiraceae bacterium]|nr:leucine-rich repeat domain-containing protein [Oscillospiraceae bacterium]
MKAMTKKKFRILIMMVFCVFVFMMTESSIFTAYALTSSDWAYEIKADGTVEIKNYSGKQKDLTVPGVIDGRTVTSIGSNAFSGNRSLKSIYISDGVEIIGNNAFFNSSVSWVILPESLTTIEYSAFYNCKKLTHIFIPKNVDEIGFEAFGGTSSLMTVYFMSPTEPLNMPMQGNAFWGMPAGARAVVPNSTNLSMNYTINGETGKWNNLIVYTEEQFGINYSAYEVIAPANGPDGNTRPGFSINLSSEILTVPTYYTILSYSLDGGQKWKPMRPELLNHANFPKLLEKGMTLSLSDSAINPITRQPYDNLNVITFPLIKSRPQITRYNINYAIRADITGATSGRWVLSEPSRSRANETEYIGNIEIGLSMGSKVADRKGFGLMPYGGIPVLTYREFGYRIVRTPYLIRIPPQTAVQAGTPGFTYTPASRPKQIKVSSELKPPNYKINTKKQILPLRGNDTLYRGSERHLNENPLPPIPESPFPSTNLADLPLFESWYTDTRVNASTSEFIGGLTAWQRATFSKPASAKQLITTPPGTPPDDIPVGLTTVEIDGAVTITGYATVPFTSPFQQFTVTITNGGFAAMSVGDDISGWFTNRPAGLSARVVANVDAGDTTVTVEMHGTPTSITYDSLTYSYYLPMALHVPGIAVQSEASPMTTPNANARYYITNRSVTFATNTVVSGRINESLPSSAEKVTINLTGDTFTAMSGGAIVTAWFTSPRGIMPKGLQARVATAVTAGATSVTVEFHGTPTIASSSYITARIPASALQGGDLVVPTRTGVIWQIWEISLPIGKTIGGIAGTPMPSGTGTALTITLQLSGDSFRSYTGINSWITVPPGISITATVMTSTLIVFEISGTPTSTGTTVMQMNIPSTALGSGRAITLNDPAFAFVIN